MAELPVLVLGTHNRKKVEELRDLLVGLPLQVRSLDDYPHALEVVEDGDTFAANAAKKAQEQALHLKCWVLAEDSGLAVDALKGAPGVYSARYSGPEATDDTNNQKLVAELRTVPEEKRTAHYVCHAVLCNPQGEIQAQCEAYCRGRIRLEPAGENGFGYDPYFEVPEYHQTFGQLGSTVKQCLSHRGRAMRGVLPTIRRLLSTGRWS